MKGSQKTFDCEMPCHTPPRFRNARRYTIFSRAGSWDGYTFSADGWDTLATNVTARVHPRARHRLALDSPITLASGAVLSLFLHSSACSRAVGVIPPSASGLEEDGRRTGASGAMKELVREDDALQL